MGALWMVGQNVSVMPGATVFLFLSLRPPVQQRRFFFSFQIRILPSANLLSNNPIWPAPSVKDRRGACRSNLHLPPRIAASDRGREAAIRLHHAVCVDGRQGRDKSLSLPLYLPAAHTPPSPTHWEALKVWQSLSLFFLS